MNVLDGFLEMPSDFKIYDAFLVDKFSRACTYHRIVYVITAQKIGPLKPKISFEIARNL